MTLTVRSSSLTGATTAARALTHAEMDANWAHVIESSNQNFTPSGSGAVARSVSDKQDEYVTNTDYGGNGDGSTSNGTANTNTVAATGRDNGDLAARFIAGHYKGQLAINTSANKYYGDGISTRLSNTGAHTVTIASGSNDVRLFDMWIDQLDASGAFDAVHVEGSEAHLVGLDIDFAPQYGIYVASFRTMIDRVMFQAVLDTCIHIISTAHRCTISNIVIEDAGTNPNNGIHILSDWNTVSNVTLNTCDGYLIQIASGANWNTLSNITGNGAGANFMNIAGAFTTVSSASARGTTGIGFNITGGSNSLAGISTDNSTGVGILISGSHNTIAGARVSAAGSGGTAIGVSITGSNNNVTGLKVSGSTGDDLDISGDENVITGNIQGNVNISGDGNVINGVIEGNLTLALGAQGNRINGRVIGTITNSSGSTSNVIGPLTAAASLAFGNVTSGSAEDLTITVTGAAVGDTVALGIPHASVTAGASGYYAWVSAANTVTVRFWNASGGDKNPDTNTFVVDVYKHN
jgi:hypothetical protein